MSRRREAQLRVRLWLAWFWLYEHNACLCRLGLPKLCARIDEWLLP